MRPQDGALAEAYDLIETHLTENPGENMLPEERLTAFIDHFCVLKGEDPPWSEGASADYAVPRSV